MSKHAGLLACHPAQPVFRSALVARSLLYFLRPPNQCAIKVAEDPVTPHFARKQTSIIDQRTTRHPGYALSQRKRKRVEEIFGWVKTVGGLRKTRHRGVARVDWMFSFAMAAYNLVRMRNLAPAPA